MQNRLSATNHPTHAKEQRTIAPPVDIYENDDEILVMADLPGVRAEALTVTLENEELAITARRDTEPSGERLFGSPEILQYRRTFLVPRGIDANQITAEVSQGVLKVRLPKMAASKPRVIAVKTTN